MDTASLDPESAVVNLLSLWQRRRANGEKVTAAELCGDRLELLPALERQIAALQQLGGLAQDMHEMPTVLPLNNVAISEAATVDPYATLPPDSQTPTPPPSLLPDTPTVPGYEVLGILGKGGMGIVYKARQTKLNRLVALKMILHSYAGEQERLRFQIEAEAVARLHHPHFVQVFEVGEHQGAPYFSLEYCAGGSLADRLDGTPWEAKAAARLVETLARAMQAAHQAQVIHRDLKPGNVLLTAEGQPKVTDFGLAKKLDVQGQTQTGAVMGTPSYMAPEQANGSKDIGPAADVYALGAILYELLTGRPPFKAATALDTIMQVVSQEPVSVRQLQPQMARDVETICHKCLQKEPKKRYGSVLELAEDLHRFVAGEPVTARPVGRIGRSWRWCRRNPVVASLSALVMVVLLASSLVSWGLTAWAFGEKNRADVALVQVQDEQEKTQSALTAETNARKRTREALNTLTDDVMEKLFGKQAVLGEKEKAFLHKVRELYEGFAAEQGETEEARTIAAEGHVCVAKIQAFVGETQQAEEGYRLSIRLYEKLAADFPASPEHRINLAASYNRLGLLLIDRLNTRAEAESAYRQAIAVQEKVLAELSANGTDHPVCRRNLSAFYNNLGNLLTRLRRDAEAETAYRQAIAMQEKLAADSSAEPSSRAGLANDLSNLGMVLPGLGKHVEAEALYRRSISIQAKVVADFPSVPDYIALLARIHNNLGQLLLGLGKNAEAESAYRQAITNQEKLTTDFPAVPEYRISLALYHANLGLLLAAQGKHSDAETACRKSIELREKLIGDYPDVRSYRIQVTVSHFGMAKMALIQSQFHAALDWYGKAILQMETLLAKDAHDAEARPFLCQAHGGRAEVLEKLGKHSEAAQDWQRAANLVDERMGPIAHMQQAVALAHGGQHQAAIKIVEEMLNKPAQGLYASQIGTLRYDAACVYAISAAAVKDNAKLREQYAVRAVALLRQSQAEGFFKAKQQVDHLKKDNDLDFLRQRDDFKKLVVELEAKANN